MLDLGCGDGALTAKLRDLGCMVTGVDSGPEMIEAARALGLDARLIDGHELPFRDEFDAVFSNAALHWMIRPRLVIEGVWRALRPQGRFVAEFGGHGNVAAIVTAMRAVAFNGGTAARIGRRELGITPLMLIDLPSSSPALTLPFAAKAERWAALKPYVIDRA